ncbi:MAG: putative Fe-S cluster assembly protein SufT [Verrucomicrobiae bacterium]|nr:putative Fe-S cluster assembly protein SufT [Verrucomicrobiae bacterium]
MDGQSVVTLKRKVDAIVVPAGTRTTLEPGLEARVTQSLGGSYTIVVNGTMYRIDGRDGDALGFPVETVTKRGETTLTKEELEQRVWDALKTCYDPEIPINIVDLGLVYDCQVEQLQNGNFRVNVKMTLTVPGCGMGPIIQEDARSKIMAIDRVEEVTIELVWDPPWNQNMMSEAARLQLGLY